MPVESYSLYPGSALENTIHLADAWGIPPPSSFSTPIVQGSTQCRVGSDQKLDNPVSAFMCFDFGRELPGPPIFSVIHSATLRVVPDQANTNLLGVLQCILNRDGRWDAPETNEDWVVRGGPQHEDCAGFAVFTTGGVPVVDLSGPFTGRQIRLGELLGQPTTFGQSFTVNPGDEGDLESVVFRMSRQSGAGPTGDVFTDVYAIDGTGRPTGPILKTSDPVPAASLSTGGSGLPQLFTFSGAPLALAAQQYVTIMRWPNVGVVPGSWVAVHSLGFAAGDDDYTGGTAISGRRLHGFHDNAYHHARLLPHALEEDGLTPLVTPFASQVFNFPVFPTIGVPVDIDFTPLVQQWVNDAAYTPDVIGLHFAQNVAAQAGVYRWWQTSSQRLIVDYTEPVDGETGPPVTYHGNEPGYADKPNDPSDGHRYRPDDGVVYDPSDEGVAYRPSGVPFEEDD